MATQKRTPENITKKRDVGTGPYLARIISHLDPTFTGTLEVMLLREQGNHLGEQNQTYQVKCAMPFFGYTGFEYLGENSAAKSTLEAFNDTQKSYGMWFVPPDVGVTVLVVFVDGDPTQGYWIGCVPTRFANHMVPAIGGSKDVDISDADKKRLGWPKNPISGEKLPLPVAEINKRLNAKQERLVDADKIKKALHPIADRFVEQGLLDDDVRGTTTSSARREVPSMVFGISSPGPRDKRDGAKKGTIGTRQSPSATPVPVSRLGGTQFVMDDGDERYQRKTPAATGPVEYADVLAGEKGDPTIPYNEYFRVRTRTGHQILMHNSEDIIYIGNARGTTWIELTSNGKIDIFAEDSISIHSKNDLNIKADRDINMEAGRNVNIKATAEYQDPKKLHEPKNIFDARGFESGRVQIESVQNFDLLIGRNGKIHVRNDEKIQGNLDIKVMGNMRVAVKDPDAAPSVSNIQNNKIIAEQAEKIKGLHIYSYENVRIKTEKNLDVNTTGNNAFTAGGTTDIKSGKNHTETAAQIHMNGPTARTAELAEVADKIKPLPVHDNLNTDILNKNWETERYQSPAIKSIMKRVPMHEPWALHENQAPALLTPNNTDREV